MGASHHPQRSDRSLRTQALASAGQHARRRREQIRRRRLIVGRVERGVRALRRLVPDGETAELDGLLVGAADHIACLQARVRAMRIMVEALSDGSGKGSSSE